ncbi:hypothetical protein CYMTET_51846 [Cymbomonas tetramitiformis]|uniref:Uncharacterized protein n=1 Tax=Cymbomonas tetramitiformis TaxID=36881 RepID=A0AAE0BM13_9CHLO|nr:hypothetical protein CYMTET_51846 [Cymbomonas tetramitiformis]
MADAIKYEDWASTKELAAKIGRVLTTEFVEPQLREHGTVGFKYVDDRQAEEYLSTLVDQGVGTKQYVSLMETLAKESYISKFYNNYDWIQVEVEEEESADPKYGPVMGRVEYVPTKFLRQELVPVEPKPESAESNDLASTPDVPEGRKEEEVTTNCTWDNSVASDPSAAVDPLSRSESLSPRATKLKTAKKNAKLNGRSLEHEVVYYVVQETAGDGEIITAVTPLWREESNQVGVMQTGLQHPVFEALLGPHIVHFKPQLYYWGLCYEMLRRVAVTSVVILIQSTLEAPRYDVIYAQVVCVLALMMQAQIKPYSRSNINIMQTLFIGSQALVMLLLTTEKYVTETPFESDVCGWLLVVMQVALMVFVLYHVWREAAPLLAEQFRDMLPSSVTWPRPSSSDRRSRVASGLSSYSMTDNL